MELVVTKEVGVGLFKLVYLTGEEIKARGFDEDLIASHQLQFTKALLCDFDLDQFLAFAVVADQFKTDYRADRENMGHVRRKRAAVVNHPVDMDIVGTHVSYGCQFLGVPMFRCIDFNTILSRRVRDAVGHGTGSPCQGIRRRTGSPVARTPRPVCRSARCGLHSSPRPGPPLPALLPGHG